MISYCYSRAISRLAIYCLLLLVVAVVQTRSVSFLPQKDIHRISLGSSDFGGGAKSVFHRSSPITIRGGSTTTAEEEEDHDDEEIESTDITQDPDFPKLQAYRMKQQMLMQLRATFLSEALAKRGLPMPTLTEVATPEGAQPPQPVDWDCALATEEDPKSCLYSFDAEPNTKVVAPLNTTQWISLGALNRLRRTDTTKVEPMWHSQYAVLESWFHPDSEYSLLQHVGIQGFLLNSLLQGLPLFLGVSLVVVAIICMPVFEYMVNRILVSSLLWSRWPKWGRFVHAALPLKLLMGQLVYKFAASGFGKLLSIVKDYLVEVECQILEQHIPLTVGVPTIDRSNVDDDDWDLDYVDLEEYSTDHEDESSFYDDEE